MKFKTTAKIIFEPKPYSNKLIHQSTNEGIIAGMAIIDDDLSLYYAWLFNKRFGVELLRHPRKSHVTFLNDKILDLDKYNIAKEKWKNKKVEIIYKPYEIRGNHKAWWIKVDCPILDIIREDIGLSKYIYGYHITIGLINKHDMDSFDFAYKYCMLYENE